MGAIFEFIANMFGYVLNFIYNIVNNYGLAVIIFTILLKLVMMPYNIKQQKTMKKSQKIQEQVKAIQEKYSSDPVRQNQEVMDLYKREKISPMSGCLGTLVTLFIFISIFYLVSRPLTFMRHIDSSKLEEYTAKLNGTYVEQKVEETSENKQEENKEESKEEATNENQASVENKENNENSNQENVEEVNKDNNQENNDNNKQEETKQEENSNNNGEQKRRNYIEIAIIREFGDKDQDVYLNMNFLGLNLSDIPSENFSNWTVFIIPALYVITSLVMMKLTKMQTAQARKEAEKEQGVSLAKKEGEDGKSENKEDDQQVAMEQMTKTMTYMMPIMSVSISLIAPLGLALYWFVSNLFAIGERLITNLIVKKSGEE